MECSNCGAELADGAKFCGECGSKVAVKKPAPIVDWSNDSIGVNDIEATLSAESLERLVRELKCEIRQRAAPGRLLIKGDNGFDDKINNFVSVYRARVGNDEQESYIRNGAVALFDYGAKGIGSCGFVFSDNAVYCITNETPTSNVGMCITGRIPWKIFFKFAKSVDGKSFWQIKMSEILSSDVVDADVKSQIKATDHIEKLFFTTSVTGLEWSYMAHELSRIKGAICGKDEIVIDPLEICGIFRKLKSQLKTDRIYFTEDEPFEMKRDTLLKSAASVLQGMSVDEGGFSVMDRTVRFKGDEPRRINIKKDDCLVALDNSKASLFGGFDKRPCLCGGLVTKKGIFAYNWEDGKKGCRSGFAPWSVIATLDPSMNSCFGTGMKLFYKRAFKSYPEGISLELLFDRAGMKKQYSRYYAEAIIHLWYFAHGIKKPFDFEWYVEADEMGDAEDGDAMGDAEDCDSMGEAD